MTIHTKKRLWEISLFIVTLLLAIIFFFPIFFNLMSAFKSNAEIMKDAIAFPKGLYLDSFKYLLTETEFPRAILNSLILTLVSIVAQVLIIPMAGYAIERRNVRWTKFMFLYFMAGMMIPFQAYMIPLFKELRMFGLYGSLAGPILVYVAGAVGFGCLLYTSFVKGIPQEIEEAAEIDGCSRYGIFGKLSSRLWDRLRQAWLCLTVWGSGMIFCCRCSCFLQAKPKRWSWKSTAISVNFPPAGI